MTHALDKKRHKIWITRPQMDADTPCHMLSNLGIQTVLQPLLQVRLSHTPLYIHENTHTYQAVVFTSANGVRAYVKNRGDVDIPAFAVGDVTTESAQKNGFKTVHTAQGDVVSLADMIKEKLSPDDGYIYHPASTVVARDLGTLLQDYGYRVKRQVVYTINPCTTLPIPLQNHIRGGSVGGVVLMSPRTADIFSQMVTQHDLDIHHMHIFALSKAVADRVGRMGVVHTAHYPNFLQVLRQIKREYNMHDEYR